MKVPSDLKEWYALACPVKGQRFDQRTLELMDTNGDGRLRSDEVLAAIDYLNAHESEASAAEDERLAHYREHLPEFLDNFVTMKALYKNDGAAMFQMGTVRIDARELHLVFHVEDEEAHSALSGKSNCFVLYLAISRPEEEAKGTICAVVTAGTVGGLYVGRNAVFYDRDGKNWDAVITKVVENQVSLTEAFWAPWRKLGEAIAGAVKKFFGDKQDKALAELSDGTKSGEAGGAALASSVAAIGIGVGMLGAAAASIITAIKGLQPWWMFLVAIAAVVLVVSLPSVILTWFKLRKRDLGAILNARGWAINRPIKMSMREARQFTQKR